MTLPEQDDFRKVAVNSPEYKALHNWIIKNWGKGPCEIEDCRSTINIEWANLTGVYDKNRDNWMRMCRSHHRKYDFDNNPGWRKKIGESIAGKYVREKHPNYRHDITKEWVSERRNSGHSWHEMAREKHTTVGTIKKRFEGL